nr:MAG TPA: hypothetical protein [Caudoviricetes sp.]
MSFLLPFLCVRHHSEPFFRSFLYLICTARSSPILQPLSYIPRYWTKLNMVEYGIR